MDAKGFTMIELLVTVMVVAILMVAAGFQFLGWQSKYEVETQVNDLYGDIMEMRMRAMQTNTIHYIRLDNTDDINYTIYREDGDGIVSAPPEAGADIAVDELSKVNLKYPLRWNFVGANPVYLQADSKGLMNLNGTVWVVDPQGRLYIPGLAGASELDNVDLEVDYDCAVITSTRINKGKLDINDPPTGGTCVAK